MPPVPHLEDLAWTFAGEPDPSVRASAEGICEELRTLFCSEVDCNAYKLEIRLFGSIFNKTHLRSSDADIALIPRACLHGVHPHRGPSSRTVCDVMGFREFLFPRLERRFGRQVVCHKHKAILISETGRGLSADVVVLLPRQWPEGRCERCGRSRHSEGYELRSSCAPERIIRTWPEYHLENADAFDQRTGGWYRRGIRAAKGLLKSGLADFGAVARDVPSILVENLFACVSPETYLDCDPSPYQVVKNVVERLRRDVASGQACQFRELSARRCLFDETQTWSVGRLQASLERFTAQLQAVESGPSRPVRDLLVSYTSRPRPTARATLAAHDASETVPTDLARKLIDDLGEKLDIPDSMYAAAERSYQAVGRWLERDGSTLAGMGTEIYPQGSFRLGTVIRPLGGEERYDLDAVCEVNLDKSGVSQQELKRLLGEELRAYARARGMSHPEETRRCWRLHYASEAQFHLDILPALPDTHRHAEELDAPQRLWVDTALAITDTKHPDYRVPSERWPRSNPSGYAAWFTSRMQPSPGRLVSVHDSVEPVPPPRERTTLQRAIQIMKRHRDLRFVGSPENKPISIIITTLAAHAYRGEASLLDALLGILTRMSDYVQLRDGVAWIANPTDGRENFADKWQEFPERRAAFEDWLETLRSDINGAAKQSNLVAIVDSLSPRLGRDMLESIAAGPKYRRDTALAPRPSAALAQVADAPHRKPMPWTWVPSGSVEIREAKVSQPGFRPRPLISDVAPLPRGCTLEFTAQTDVRKPYKVYWQIVNTGDDATRSKGLRGGFEECRYERGHLTKSECTQYSGAHGIQCFIVKDTACVAKSNLFIVNIR